MSAETRISRPFVRLGDRKQSDEIYKRLLDAAPDAVIVVDESGSIVLANIQTERLFGYHRDDLVGEKVEILIPDRFRGSHVGHRSRFFAAPKVRPMGSGLDLFGRKRDGTEFPLEISLSPLPTEEGLLISASIRDVTDRKQNELKIRRIQEHLLSAVESIQGAFAIFDAEDHLVLCNTSYRRMFGREMPEDNVGHSFEELLDGALARNFFDITRTTEVECRSRFLAHHRDPSSAIDVRGSNGKSFRIVEHRTAEAGTVMTIWNVTEDVQHEEELRRARAAAEAASSAKSEFLASMSHELRTPLNAILGFAQLLRRDKKIPLSERHRERIDHVLKGGDHLLRLIDDVLDLSRIEAGRVSVSLESIDIAEVLAEVKTTLDPMASRAEIELVVAPVPSDFPRGVADRTRFKQILMNFGSNAIKYGRKGGSATLLTVTQDSAVRVTVADDGMGIPEDKQDKIFQPFHRAGQETGPIEGTGIGLTISKRLAELMEASVGFRSAEGEGSEFWIEIPAYRPVSAPTSVSKKAAAADNPLTVPRAQRYLIVYIEDNPSSIALMEELISDFDSVELITAPTAEIGLEVVRTHQPQVVIMDINLPGMNGFEATRRLREWPETRGIPIVALSAAAMVRDKVRIDEAGFHRYLTKPVNVDELVGVLEELLVSRSTGSNLGLLI